MTKKICQSIYESYISVSEAVLLHIPVHMITSVLDDGHSKSSTQAKGRGVLVESQEYCKSVKEKVLKTWKFEGYRIEMEEVGRSGGMIVFRFRKSF